MTRCRPGDLALVLHSDYEEIIGRVCLVLKDHDTDRDGDWCWLCRFPSKVTWCVWEDDEAGGEVKARSGMIPDAWLLPLRHPGDDTRDNAWDWLPPVPNDISAEDPQDLREALKQWAEEQR